MIIGLTGSIGAGHGVVAEFLKEKGFVYLSLSDELREIAKQRKIGLTRENLQNLGNQLREEQGSGVLAKLVVDKIKNQQYINAIVDGIRNPAEIEELKKLKNFFLVSVDAPMQIRFQRVVERNRESDPKTWEDFLKVEARDKGEGEPETGQRVSNCMALADFTLINSGTMDEVSEKVKELYGKICSKISRPTWDEYFLKQAFVVAERSTCLHHHIGAVIVRDKRIITTGYNASVSGGEHCCDSGYCMKEKKSQERGEEAVSGKGVDDCLAIHAERNAIDQAALLGNSLKGATIYITHQPCVHCARDIVQVGIVEVKYVFSYADERGLEILSTSNVKHVKLPMPDLKIGVLK